MESDANIKVAARRIALTKFSNAGQMCVAPDYVLVHQSVKEELIQELKKNIEQFFSKDAATSYDYGKIINEKQFNRLVNYLQHGRIMYGGAYNPSAQYLEPTLIEDIALDTAVMGEEIFGPVLPLISFTTFEEAKQIISRHPDPLAFYVFTQSTEKEKQWIEQVPFGGGCVNNASWHLTNFNLPFGGTGQQWHWRLSWKVFLRCVQPSKSHHENTYLV